MYVSHLAYILALILVINRTIMVVLSGAKTEAFPNGSMMLVDQRPPQTGAICMFVERGIGGICTWVPSLI